MQKQFEIRAVVVEGNSISWDIVRIGHETRGDYLMATVYDRGAVQIFAESLVARGFTDISR